VVVVYIGYIDVAGSKDDICDVTTNNQSIDDVFIVDFVLASL